MNSGRIIRKRSIGVVITGSESEKPISENNEYGSSESDFDLP
jgi:hypothetical protein